MTVAGEIRVAKRLHTEGTKPLTCLFERLEGDSSLFEPRQLRKRIEALDELDAQWVDGEAGALTSPVNVRAHTIRARLESANTAIYDSIRARLQNGEPDELRAWIYLGGDSGHPKPGLDYDALDELISGVLQFKQPRREPLQPGPEMVFYQPTPARHILQLIRASSLRAADVLVDLGSGLGHVPILVSILAGARCIGIEIDAALVESSRECARGLGLNGVTFVEADARAADFSAGTVFYLYAPFTGSMLDAVLHKLRSEGTTRDLRVRTLGPCTPAVAQQPWLTATTAIDPNRITCFQSTADQIMR